MNHILNRLFPAQFDNVYRGNRIALWLFIFLEYAGRRLIGIYKPLETVETAPGQTAAYVLPIVALVMLVLALWPEKQAN